MQKPLVLAFVLVAGCTNPDASTSDPLDDDLSAPLVFGCGDDDSPDDDDGPDSCGRFAPEGRAWGVSANVLGLLSVPAFPDTDRASPQTLLDVSAALCTACASLSIADAVFSVESEGHVTDISASNVATATTNDLSISLPGLRLGATTLQVRAEASARYESEGTASASGVVQDLRINGFDYVDLHEPTVITITEPITCTPIAEVRILETIQDPDDPAAIQINGLHVVIFDLALTPFIDESTDIIVAHAESAIRPQSCSY